MKQLLKALNMIRQCSPRAFGWRIVFVVLLSLLPLANLCVLKMLVDGVTTGTPPLVMGHPCPLAWLLAVFCGVFLLNRLLSVCDGVNNDLLSQRLADYLSDRMQRQAAALDMAYFDNPAYHDTCHRAQQEASFRPLQVLSGFMGLLGSLLSLAGVAVMLAAASGWIIVVMVLGVAPSFVVRIIKSRKIYAFRRSNTQTYRRTSYYSALLGGRDFAKEMRTYGLAPYFRKRFVDIRRRLVSDMMRISRRLAVYDALCAVVETAALFFITLFLISNTVSGVLTIGSFVMLFEAFRRGQSYLSNLVASVTGLYDNRLFVGNLFEFLDLEPRIVNPDDPADFPQVVERVEFRDVTFRYPDMDRDVLSHFCLAASAGEVTLIEGENGCGKTTLVKLLLRLYDPDAGAVLINGVDIRRFRLEQLRRGIGVIFQDYVRFYCTAEENIAFGDITRYDHGRVAEAARRAGADKVVERLSAGYETPLGRMFDQGEELSMGQWQRMALARQLYGDAPVMVFDEPTAWMDVPSRDRFEQTLAELKQQHKVIILIKHV